MQTDLYSSWWCGLLIHTAWCTWSDQKTLNTETPMHRIIHMEMRNRHVLSERSYTAFRGITQNKSILVARFKKMSGKIKNNVVKYKWTRRGFVTCGRIKFVYFPWCVSVSVSSFFLHGHPGMMLVLLGRKLCQRGNESLQLALEVRRWVYFPLKPSWEKTGLYPKTSSSASTVSTRCWPDAAQQEKEVRGNTFRLVCIFHLESAPSSFTLWSF